MGKKNRGWEGDDIESVSEALGDYGYKPQGLETLQAGIRDGADSKQPIPDAGSSQQRNDHHKNHVTRANMKRKQHLRDFTNLR